MRTQIKVGDLCRSKIPHNDTNDDCSSRFFLCNEMTANVTWSNKLDVTDLTYH